jgi:prophage regulatory protein
MEPSERILRLPTVLHIAGLSTSTLRRLEQEGSFPRRRQLGESSVGWVASEVDEWIRNRPAASASPSAGPQTSRHRASLPSARAPPHRSGQTTDSSVWPTRR